MRWCLILLFNRDYFTIFARFLQFKMMTGTSCIRNWRVDRYDGCAVDLFSVYDI